MQSIEDIKSKIKRRVKRLFFSYSYDKEFYEYIFNKYNEFADIFVKAVLKTYPINSVVDVGCGNGLYLRKFSENRIDILGYEGSKSAIKFSLVPPCKIVKKDLRKLLQCDKKFDICLSLEVAEHLEERYSRIFVDSLASLSNVVIFSAAHPKQGGLRHYNEQPQSYWIKLFRDKCFKYNEEKVKAIKSELENSDINLDLMYPYINLMIFEK